MKWGRRKLVAILNGDVWEDHVEKMAFEQGAGAGEGVSWEKSVVGRWDSSCRDAEMGVFRVYLKNNKEASGLECSE